MLAGILAFVFWGCLGLLVYVYVGYPLLLTLLARFSDAPFPDSDLPAPPVTLLISAFNESQVIAAKLENSLTLEYPNDRLEIVVISDSSDDGTDEIVQQYSPRGVRLLRQEPRMGKTAGLNLGVSEARGQILVFSDANAMYQPDAVRRLVRHFSNPRVGYVVGNARYYEKGTESQSAQSEGLYWKLETYLKKKESIFDSVVGGDGAIYAIRRELYLPLLPTDINDFLNPLQIISRGYAGVFEPAAVCYEEAAQDFSQEYRRKVRIISRSLNALGRVPEVLNPLRNARHWFLLVSHKVLRWFAPFFMVFCFAASFALWKFPFYKYGAILQTAFYALALIGWKWRPENKFGEIISLAFYFCLVNLASLVGCIKCFRGDLSGKWAPPRQKLPIQA
ncbi:MAG TPA: glycosyltransferase family 2 protein [Candidatus Acidoferrum sp.]|nr:glycosyltransferase family 2 protein [Candidatus Acidoferrum sp.]